MLLSEALETAKVLARVKAATEGWRTRKFNQIRCKVKICKLQECAFLYYRVEKGRVRPFCEIHNKCVSNIYLKDAECQGVWGSQE